MLDKSVLDGWKLLAEEGKMFHAETVLVLIEHIEHLDDINTDLAHECEMWESKYIHEEEQEMSHGNA